MRSDEDGPPDTAKKSLVRATSVVGAQVTFHKTSHDPRRREDVVDKDGSAGGQGICLGDAKLDRGARCRRRHPDSVYGVGQEDGRRVDRRGEGSTRVQEGDKD